MPRRVKTGRGLVLLEEACFEYDRRAAIPSGPMAPTGSGDSFRAKGPAICIAQPNGLGERQPHIERANGPAICGSSCRTVNPVRLNFDACNDFHHPTSTLSVANCRAVGPTLSFFGCLPSPLDWAMQTVGALPLKPGRSRPAAGFRSSRSGSGASGTVFLRISLFHTMH